MSLTLETFIIIFIVALIIAMYLMYAKLGKFLDSARKDLTRLTDEVDRLTKDVSEVKSKIIITMEMTDKVAAQASDVIVGVKKQADRLNDAVEPVINLVNGFYHRIAPPVRQTAGVISGLTKAINTFFERTTQKKA